MLERRMSHRRRTLLSGRISIDKVSTFEVDCTVRNISDGGARLALRHGSLLPPSFRLGISDGAGQHGRLVWYRNGEAGISFGGAPAAQTTAKPPADEPPPLRVRMQAIMDRRAGCAYFTRP